MDSVLNLPDDTRMLDVVRLGLSRADDVRIAVSFTRCSGLGLLIDPLQDVVDRGGKVRLLTSTYQAVSQPEGWLPYEVLVVRSSNWRRMLGRFIKSLKGRAFNKPRMEPSAYRCRSHGEHKGSVRIPLDPRRRSRY
jgi:hypothetical protein